jgi:integral membrane protein (TIGR00529 family)
MLIWAGFSLAVVAMLYLSRKSLSLGMAVGAFLLAAFTLRPVQMLEALRATFADPSVLLLALVVGTIPMIGGVLERSGEMDRLVANMRIGTKPFLAIAPALLGLLPMPGGALLSAPLLERGAPQAAGDVKAAANVWFRHTLLIVYPLGSALIAAAKIAEVDVYRSIPYLLPGFLLMSLLGYVFLLRGVAGRAENVGPFSLRGLVVPLVVLLLAPALDIVLKSVFDLPYSEMSTAIGVGASLVLAVGIGRVGPSALLGVFRAMRPWKFSLIIIAVFVFLNVFTASGAPESLAALALPPAVLTVGVALVLGFVTGRIETPASIVIPIYVMSYGSMSIPTFAVTYFAAFLGYLITPTHPCISVSLEYFSTSLWAFLRKTALPFAIAVAVISVVGFLVVTGRSAG